MSLKATVLVLLISRLDPAFFQLRTGLAGEILQKFIPCGLRVVLLGDSATLAESSNALRDVIGESNRGGTTWFLPDWDTLKRKLAAAPECA